MISTYKVSIKLHKSEKEKSRYDDMSAFVVIMSVIISLFTFFISLAIFSSLVEYIVIPEVATYKSLTQNRE
jgi:ABC-type microcin C transport system permease subunit YejB